MDDFDRLRLEEFPPERRLEVCIGADVASQVPPEELANLVKGQCEQGVPDAAKMELRNADGKAVTMYLRCGNGNKINVGTRKDFADLGGESICDALDAEAPF